MQVELERSRDELGALEERKAEALAAEAYEEAAGLRDQIALLQEFVTEHTPVLKTEVMARGHEERSIDWAARLHGGRLGRRNLACAATLEVGSDAESSLCR